MNTNGLISFGEPVTSPPTSLMSSFPPGVTDGVPIIAPFYADIDITHQGNISVTEVNNTQTISTILSLINTSFEQRSQFSPSLLYNVSWSGVGRYLKGILTDIVSLHNITLIGFQYFVPYYRQTHLAAY